MFSTVVYDLDGTLVDSAITVAELLNGLRAERNLAALPTEAYTPWLSVGGRAMIAAALAIPENDAQPFLETFRARYLARSTDPGTVFPEVHATLEQLQRNGVRLALCTNKPRQLTEKVLAETGLATFFEVICAGNDLPTSKPHPDNLNSCLSALGSNAKETIMVGDSRVDQATAAACGTYFAFFSGGYDDGVHLETAMTRINCHSEILSLLAPFEERPHCE